MPGQAHDAGGELGTSPAPMAPIGKEQEDSKHQAPPAACASGPPPPAVAAWIDQAGNKEREP